MFERNLFFRIVWRLNALLIFGVGIMGILVLGYLSWHLWDDAFGERQREGIVNIDEDAAIDLKWQYRAIVDIDGSDYVMMPLESAQGYEQDYYGKFAEAARNVLFVNLVTNDFHWLFPDHNRLVLQHSAVSEMSYSTAPSIVRVIVFLLVEEDTSQDNRLTRNDLKTIALSHPEGQDVERVVTGVDELIGLRVVDKHRLVLLYQKDGQTHSMAVALSNFSISSNRVIFQPE